jgi:hypothetical protein
VINPLFQRINRFLYFDNGPGKEKITARIIQRAAGKPLSSVFDVNKLVVSEQIKSLKFQPVYDSGTCEQLGIMDFYYVKDNQICFPSPYAKPDLWTILDNDASGVM